MTQARKIGPEKIGIVLFNLGGPHNLDAVEPFLFNLFMDPDIFTFPLASLVRKPLARFISSRRASKSRVYFEYMGGKSPIIDHTLDQARALEKSLNHSQRIPNTQFKVVVAMRYWKPFASNAIRILKREGIEKIVLLPLYPQYSYTTTRSSLVDWKESCKKMGVSFEQEFFISDYFDHPLYLKSVAGRIQEAIAKFDENERTHIHLLFSAHGIPLKEIKAGDPYEQQIKQSVMGVMRELGDLYPHTLAYQSKVGPLKWLQPNTVDVIPQLAAKGVRNLIAIPISFVSDHSETLYELKKMYGELALQSGIRQYELMPALNDSGMFIGALGDVVWREILRL